MKDVWLQGKLPACFQLFSSVTLPFEIFEAALEDGVNNVVQKDISSLLTSELAAIVAN